MAVTVIDPGPILHAQIQRYDDPDIETGLQQVGVDPDTATYRLIDVSLDEQLDLAGVEACPDMQTQRRHPTRNRADAADRPGRAVEGGQHPIAGRLDRAPTRGLNLPMGDRVVDLQQLTPPPVTHCRRHGGRIDDAGEGDGGQDAIAAGNLGGAGQELLQLVEEAVGVGCRPGPVAAVGQLQILRPRDVLGQVSPLGGDHEPVPADWTTRVGTAIAASTSRTSSWKASCCLRTARRGLPAARSTRAHHALANASPDTSGARTRRCSGSVVPR
jgi:hypothetical protein